MSQNDKIVQHFIDQYGNIVSYQAEPKLVDNQTKNLTIHTIPYHRQPKPVNIHPLHVIPQIRPRNIHLQPIYIAPTMPTCPKSGVVGCRPTESSLGPQRQQIVPLPSVIDSINENHLEAQNNGGQQPRNDQTSLTNIPQSIFGPLALDLFKKVLNVVANNGGSITLVNYLIRAFVTKQIDLKTLISTFKFRNIYTFNNQEQKILCEYMIYLDIKRSNDPQAHSFTNVHQINSSANIIPNIPSGDCSGSQTLPISSNYRMTPDVLPIPRLSNISNNERIGGSNDQNIKIHLTQSERSENELFNTIFFQDPKDMKSGSRHIRIREQSVDTEEEEDDTICGHSLNEEMKLIKQMQNTHIMKPCKLKIKFDYSNIISILKELCTSIHFQARNIN
ncbi:hypothetical protein RF11_10409 [Thelohanellus kitauei]|uniref:Uncharacterized protein n=1 Tax=Thelohanellus kitauei TaxID=669202 RepID=A0A0C2MDV8_THEKT|nr:hypothetical protein RF11_10409 [Thelohanellus kitauei]